MAKYTWTSHPSIVDASEIPSNVIRLKVFEYLKKDPTLPKHLIDGMVVLKGRKPMTVEQYLRSSDGMSSYRTSQYSKRMSNGYKDAEKKEGFLKKTFNCIASLFKKKEDEKKEVPPETFKTACDMISKNIISQDLEKTAIKLKTVIDKTKANGQSALADRLLNEHQNLINEVILVKNGLFHYLTEEDAINLLKTADFGIRIDFWNDYPDIVPDEVMEKKKKADALRVFDNWCIMHYDPKGTTLKQMKTEEWKRDPILFGMIVGSDRLYYVADWKTKDDDLTIDKVCEILNIKSIREAREYGADSPYSGIIQRVEGSNDSESFDDPMMDTPIDPSINMSDTEVEEPQGN